MPPRARLVFPKVFLEILKFIFSAHPSKFIEVEPHIHEESLSSATGWVNPDLAEVTSRAIKEVLDGIAAGEREGVALKEKEFQWPVLASLLISLSNSGNRPAVALCSETLHYLPEPMDTIDELGRCSIKHLTLDRFPVVKSTDDVLSVQKVRRHTPKGDYAMVIFSRHKLLNSLNRHWTLRARWKSLDGVSHTNRGRQVFWEGFYFSRE